MDGWFQATYYGQDNNDYGSDSTNATTVSNTNVDDGMIESLSSSAAISGMKDINTLWNIQLYNEVMQYHREKSCTEMMEVHWID